MDIVKAKVEKRPEPSSISTKRRNGFVQALRRYAVPYSYVAPFFILFAIFGVFPIVYAFYLGFHQWDGLDDMKFIGLGNYQHIVSDPVFWKAVYNTLYIGIVAHIPMLFLA